MNIIEKRSRIRDLKKSGTIPAHSAPAGVVIAGMTNDDADKLLSRWDTEAEGYTGKASANETESNGNGHAKAHAGHAYVVPNGGNDLASLIAAAIAPHVTAQPATVSQEQFDALAAHSEALTARLEALSERIGSVAPRELRVILPNGEARDIGASHYRFPELLLIVSQGVHAYLPGPAGSFKSHAAAQVAQALGLDFSCLSVCQQTTQVALLGYMDATGNYVTTEFRRRYENGGVFLLDEMDKGNANTLAVLNGATSNGHCAFPDGMITRHEDFRLIAAANTYGNGGNAQYVGSCQIDGATLDRFAFLEWKYDEQLEEIIAIGKSDLPSHVKPKGTAFHAEQWPAKVRALRKAAAEIGSRLIISPRATFNGVKLLTAGMDLETVMACVIWKGTAPEEIRKIEAAAR